MEGIWILYVVCEMCIFFRSTSLNIILIEKKTTLGSIIKMQTKAAHSPQLQDVAFNLRTDFQIIWAANYNYPTIYQIGKSLQHDILSQTLSLQP